MWAVSLAGLPFHRRFRRDDCIAHRCAISSFDAVTTVPSTSDREDQGRRSGKRGHSRPREASRHRLCPKHGRRLCLRRRSEQRILQLAHRLHVRRHRQQDLSAVPGTDAPECKIDPMRNNSPRTLPRYGKACSWRALSSQSPSSPSHPEPSVSPASGEDNHTMSLPEAGAGRGAGCRVRRRGVRPVPLPWWPRRRGRARGTPRRAGPGRPSQGSAGPWSAPGR